LYAESLAEFGHPLPLALSGGHLLRRRVPHSEFDDAMGCYPLFSCTNWRGLAEDVDDLRDVIVSVSLVTDPFGDYDLKYLRRCFPDRVIPFKEHVVVDLAGSPFDRVTRHHRVRAAGSLRKVTVKVSPEPLALLPVWSQLYADFVIQRGIVGLRAFSARAFALQLATPGIVMFVAEVEGRAVGAHLWYEQGDVCHSHLAVSSAEGRHLRAGFALYWAAIEHFRGHARWLNLGGAAGTRPADADGLATFKRGWSSETRPTYLCGRILHPGPYASLAAIHGAHADYFPCYRRGEFQ
jgi:hypothetical protein